MKVGSQIKVAAVALLVIVPIVLGYLFVFFRGDPYIFNNIRALFFASLAISLGIGWYWAFQARARFVVGKWASKHGYVVLQLKKPFLSGEFSFGSTSRGQVVYCLTIRDTEGHKRTAWVRCGSFLFGALFSDAIEVRWQDETTTA